MCVRLAIAAFFMAVVSGYIFLLITIFVVEDAMHGISLYPLFKSSDECFPYCFSMRPLPPGKVERTFVSVLSMWPTFLTFTVLIRLLSRQDNHSTAKCSWHSHLFCSFFRAVIHRVLIRSQRRGFR